MISHHQSGPKKRSAKIVTGPPPRCIRPHSSSTPAPRAQRFQRAPWMLCPGSCNLNDFMDGLWGQNLGTSWMLISLNMLRIGVDSPNGILRGSNGTKIPILRINPCFCPKHVYLYGVLTPLKRLHIWAALCLKA